MSRKLLIGAVVVLCLSISIAYVVDLGSVSDSAVQLTEDEVREYQQLTKLRTKLDPDSPEGIRNAARLRTLEKIRLGEAKAEAPHQFARILHEMRIPYGATEPAYPPNHKMTELTKARRNSPQSPNILPWISRGPGNVPGRARGIAVDPGDPNYNTWYFGSVGGGIWKTTNAGATWRDLTPTMPNLAMSEVIQSPSNPNIMYAGTGESMFSVDVVNGDGILKSTDRGETWYQLTSTTGNDNFNNIARMIVDPQNPDIVLAATTSGRYKQNTVNRSSIYKTTNGGTTWYQVYNETEIGQAGRIKRVLHIVATPGNFNIQYAAVREKGILKSTNAGESWFLSSNGINDLTGRYELAIAPSNVNRIYAAAEGTPNTNLYVTTDAGANWTLTTVSGTNVNWLSSQGWYDNTIVVHPTNENRVYVGGVNLYVITMISETQRTIASMSAGAVHVDHHNLMIIPKPNNSFRIINANDGGMGISTDSSTGWINPGNGMITSQFYGVDKRPGASAYFGGMQDNGTWRSPINPNALTGWTSQIGGDGYETSWHFDDPLRLIGGSQYNGLRRSTNGGSSFATATSGLATGSGNAPFITKIAKTNMEPDLLFAVGASGVYKSTNFGQNWVLTSIPSSTWGPISSFLDVRISRANPDIVWAGSRMDATGKIHLSTNRGVTFSPVPDFTGTTMGGISGISTHPWDDSTAYVLFSFAQKPKILRTTNLGQTWEDISGFIPGPSSNNGFPDVAVYDLLVLPHTPNVLWAGTEIGLFESTNSGASWHLANNGMPAACIWFMTHVEDEVVLATHGRGVWSVNIPGLAGGQTFKPLLGTMAQAPDGMLSIPVTLRGLYDSTIVAINDTPFVKLGANPVAMRDTVVKYPVLQARTLTVSVTSYKGGVVYPSLARSVAVVVIAPARAAYSNTFNSATSDFTGTGFSVTTPTGFTDGGIHTAHPYSNNLNNTYMLTIPVTVAASNAYLAYDDVALVEPGEPGSAFGNPSFYDYVVVEGTRDGINWIPLADGYDAAYDPTWLNAYNTSTPGNATMYRHHEVNLRDVFGAGENIFIRFRLYTDASVTGWGWAIDNLEIQERITDVAGGNGVPSRFALEQNFPNPFNPETRISYQLPRQENTVLKIFNVNGQELRTLVNETQRAGSYSVMWDGKNARGLAVASGIYFYRLSAGTFAETRKMVLTR